MGCQESKSTSVYRRNERDRNIHEFEEDSMTIEDAVAYVRKQLGLSEVKARQLVGDANVDDDGNITGVEQLRLWLNIRAMKEKLETSFHELDKDKSGSVTTLEAVGTLVTYFEGADDTVLLKILKRFDENGDGKINYEEFVIFYCFVSAKKSELIRKFSEMDRDDSGVLDANEVALGLTEMCGMSTQQARSLVDEFDTSMDDKINKHEFNNMWFQIFPDLKEDTAKS